MSYDDLDLDLASPPRATHRRSRSDPTDFMQSVRGERARVDVGGKRESSWEAGVSPAIKKGRAPGAGAITFGPEADAHKFDLGSLVIQGLDGVTEHPPTEPNHSKKDVPMWTVQEDLLILKLVEQYGKRWSKIAARLPGRTDNGVRNRWNRMERAQLIKSKRGAPAGYRCRRCGEPKRGHICAARTLGGEAPEAAVLTKQAAALTELSAHAIQSQSDLVPAAPPPQAARSSSRAKRPSPIALAAAAAAGEASSAASTPRSTVDGASSDAASSLGSPPLHFHAAPAEVAPLETMDLEPTMSMASSVGGPSGGPGEAGPSTAADDRIVGDLLGDSFLDDLTLCVSELYHPADGSAPTYPEGQGFAQVPLGAPPPVCAPPPIMSQASLQSALSSLMADVPPYVPEPIAC